MASLVKTKRGAGGAGGAGGARGTGGARAARGTGGAGDANNTGGAGDANNTGGRRRRCRRRGRHRRLRRRERRERHAAQAAREAHDDTKINAPFRRGDNGPPTLVPQLTDPVGVGTLVGVWNYCADTHMRLEYCNYWVWLIFHRGGVFRLCVYEAHVGYVVDTTCVSDDRTGYSEFVNSLHQKLIEANDGYPLERFVRDAADTWLLQLHLSTGSTGSIDD